MIRTLRHRAQLVRHVWRQLPLAVRAQQYATQAAAGGDLLYEERGGARLFTLNRPKALNAISGEMFYSLIDTLGVSLSSRVKADNRRGRRTRR